MLSLQQLREFQAGALEILANPYVPVTISFVEPEIIRILGQCGDSVSAITAARVSIYYFIRYGNQRLDYGLLQEELQRLDSLGESDPVHLEEFYYIIPLYQELAKFLDQYLNNPDARLGAYFVLKSIR